MISLDTNWLIYGLQPGNLEQHQFREWITNEVEVYVSSIVWYEFLCGATELETKRASQIIGGNILPMNLEVAGESARLFNVTGKRRKLRVDCMVAATSIVHRLPLATNNLKDFDHFVPYGLQISDDCR